MAQYEMKLKKQYYDLTLNGQKKVEIRLNDEKRKNLKAGDSIVFENMETGNRLKVNVEKVCFFKNFEELFLKIDNEIFGCSVKDLKKNLEDIYQGKDKKDGVLAIYIKR